LLTHIKAGAVKAPPKSRYSELLRPKPRAALRGEEEEGDEESSGDGSENFAEESGKDLSDDEENPSSTSEESEAEDASDGSSAENEVEAAEVLEASIYRGQSQDEGRKRKRKRRDGDEDLEANYLERLMNEEEPSVKRRREKAPVTEGEDGDAIQGNAKDAVESEADDSSADELPVHESLSADPVASELEKASRTVFLSNVSVEAITSRKAKKILLNHLKSVLDKKADPPQKVQSLRFRSTPFSTTALPKRAAYIKKSVLEATTKSTNAYVVYSTNAAARLAVAQLNGTVVLDRHLRVDSVAHPSPVDHRRCVFVGNLGFVDDETVLNVKVDEQGKQVTEKRKRTKTPMDVEEGLWRVFGEHAGKVESVRVVRDPNTRVGKGIAYVQFYVSYILPMSLSASKPSSTNNDIQDANDVESAILLNGKKFPPMLPRELRVSRCKAPHKTARAMEARKERTGTPTDRKDKKKDKAAGDGGKNASKNTVDDAGKYVPKLTAEAQTLAGRASKLLGRFGAEKLVGNAARGKPGRKERQARREMKKPHDEDGERDKDGSTTMTTATAAAIKAPEDFVFEGRRASARDGRPKDLKFKPRTKDKVHKKTKTKAKVKAKTAGRGAVRAAKWRATQKGAGGGGSK
jgi:nucleolar protein 12